MNIKEESKIKKVICVKAFQQDASFPERPTFPDSHSLPFPPYSTLIGMIHTACGWKEYHQIYLSVAISYATERNMDLQKTWAGGAETKKITDEFKKRFPYIIDLENGNYQGYVKTLSRIWFVSDLFLTLHIFTEDEKDMQHIYQSLNNPKVFLTLGKHENLLRIDSVLYTEIKEAHEIILSQHLLCPVEKIKNQEQEISNTIATIFSVKEKYIIEKGFRHFNIIKCILLAEKRKVIVNTDAQNNPVIFNNIS